MATRKKDTSLVCLRRTPKEPTLSELIQNRRSEVRPYIAGELRALLIQRKMARHNFTKEQALSEILAFSR